jgi:hypothetical protein
LKTLKNLMNLAVSKAEPLVLIKLNEGFEHV